MTQDKSPRRNPLSHQNEHLLQQKKQQITYDLHTLSILAMVGSSPCRLLYVYINTHFTLNGIRSDPINLFKRFIFLQETVYKYHITDNK